VAPKVLIATTTWWPFPARLSLALGKLGCEIAVICPSGSPARRVRVVHRSFPYGPIAPLASLQEAIGAFRPDLVIPCDDRVVAHLHDLYARAVTQGDAGASLRFLIERSLGAPESYPVALSRARLLDIAAAHGIRVPPTRAITKPADLESEASRPFPWVVKVDGSWGGSGVSIVRTMAEARKAVQRMARPISTLKMLVQLLVRCDPYPLRSWLLRTRHQVTIQDFVQGRPANTMITCWQGELLAATTVEVLSTQHRLGASAVVRLIENAEITAAARRLARELRLSGFYGLDFMLEDITGAAYLIEMNPRPTQLGHLRLSAGRDLVGALYGCLAGLPPPSAPPVTTHDTIILFPQAWHCDRQSPFLETGFLDVPWQEPELMVELLRKPRPTRGLLARLHAWYIRRDPALATMSATATSRGKAALPFPG